MEQHVNMSAKAGGASPEQTILFERAPLSVPLNLGEWMEPERLAAWVKEAVCDLNPQEPQVIRLQNYPAAERPEALLRVLLFSYCTQLYSASDIAQACHNDGLLRELCGGQPFFPDQLDRFLHRNRMLLEQLLGKLLIRAVREKFVPQGHLPPGLEHSLLDRAGDRVLTALLMDGPER